MRTRFCCRLGSVLCAAAVMLWLIAGLWLTSAASADGVLTLVCKTETAPLTGMYWHIYRVGERNTNNQLVLEGDFADYPVYLEDWSADSMSEAASTLENHAVLERFVPMQNGAVGADGTVSFSGLETGLYLLSGERFIDGDTVYIPSPMLIEMTASDEAGKTVKDLTAYAKYQVLRRPTVSDQVYSVRKIWRFDENYAQIRPVAIKVGLYCNGELAETVTLNQANDWRYSWSGDATSEWRVKEIDIPENYTVIYRGNETQYVIVNNKWTVDSSGVVSRPTETMTTTTTTTPTTTITSTTTTTMTETGTVPTVTTAVTTSAATTTTPQTTTTGKTTTSQTTTSTTKKTTTTTSSEKLPQTGQLWWPVPVCGASGLVLFAIGWRLNKKK